MRSESEWGQGGWLLLVLALPLCLVVLERFLLPQLVRWVCRGRATVRSASLVRGVHDLVWGDVIRVPYAYVRCQARMPCLVLHVRGLTVEGPPRGAAPSARPAPAVRRVSRHALMALSFLANLVAIDLQDTRVALPGAMCAEIDRIYVHASVLLRYLTPQPTTAAAACDGFDDAPDVQPSAALRISVPEARARLYVDVDDARLVHAGDTLVSLPHRTTLSLQARLRHTIMPASLSIRIHVADVHAHLDAWPPSARDERTAAPPAPSAPSAPPALLAYLAGASLSVSRATATYAGHGADPMRTALAGLHVSLDTSPPTHGVHQAWFGACGVERRRDGQVVLHEARRIFAIHLRLASWNTHVGPMHANVAHVSCWARTSCTPYGVVASEPRWCDPNEAAVVLRVHVGYVRVQPHGMFLAHVMQRRPPRSSPPTGSSWAPPRIAALVQLGALDVQEPEGLRVHVARAHLTVRGSYAERRAPRPMQYTLEASAGCDAVDAYVWHASIRHDLLHIAAPSCTYTTHVPVDMDRVTLAPRPQWRERAADVAVAVHHGDVHVWSEPVLLALEKLVRAAAQAPRHRTERTEPRTEPLPEPPPQLRHVHVHIGSTAVYVGGADAHFEPQVRRGIGLVLGAAVVDYACATPDAVDPRVTDARQALRLPRPIDHAAHAAGGAAGRLLVSDVRLCPLVHLAAAHDAPVEPEHIDQQAVYVADHWDFAAAEPTVHMPRQAPRLHQLEPGTEIVYAPQVHVDAQRRGRAPPDAHIHVTRTSHVRIRLLHSYCMLVAAAAARRLVPPRPATPAPASSATARGRVTLEAPLVHVHMDLPHERRVLVRVSKLAVRDNERVSLDALRACVPGDDGVWDEAVLARRLLLTHRGREAWWVTGDCVHVRVPYGYHTHKLIEASIVAFKATKQLFFQFWRGCTGSVIYPHAEAPKRLPAVTVRLGMLVLEAADHSLDAALNLLFRTGLDEQLLRMQRARPEHDATHWIRRWRRARDVRAQREHDVRSYIHKRAFRNEDDVRPWPPEPPLLRVSLTMLRLQVSQPTGFALDDVHAWLHAQAGNPVDLPYTTLIPMHARLRVSEALIRLRDYPLPLLHVPPRDDLDVCFDAEGDLVVAEQLGDAFSVRHVRTTIVPAVDSRHGAEHGLLVPKSAMTPKLYGPVIVHVSSQRPTILTWGHALQPALQDVVRVFDAITSPPHDPSPKPGPWDKLPFQLQASVHLFFEHDVHLHLRGARQPYELTGAGAGFVLVWRRHVELRLGRHQTDHEFLQVRSGEHLLAIPDVRPLLDPAGVGLASPRACSPQAVLRRPDAPPPLALDKVCWQLAGGVRWGMGLVSEHTCTDETCERTPRCHGAPFYRACRFFGRIPHWRVRLRTFEGYARLPPAERTDSYRGWRSDFAHLSLSLQAIGDERQADTPRNCLYVSWRAWDHFRDWLHLFSDRLHLPIRHGPAFPKPHGAKSPKFGRFVATIKYRFHITDLYAAHTYPRRTAFDIRHHLRTFVGVKARVGACYLDLHQRLQESPPAAARRKPLYEAEADVRAVQLFALCARFRESGAARHLPSVSVDAQDDVLRDVFVDMDAHDTADQRMYDPRDWDDMGAAPCADSDPLLLIRKVLTLARFHLHRLLALSATRRPSAARDTSPIAFSKFGHEHTHTCRIGQDPHASLAQQRVEHLEHDIHTLLRTLDVCRTHQRPPTHHAYLDALQRACERARAELGSPDEPAPVRLGGEGDAFHHQILVDRPVGALTHKTRAVLLQYYEGTLLHRSFVQRLSVTEQRQIRALLERARPPDARRRTETSAHTEDASALLDDVVADTTRLASQSLPDTFVSDFGAEHSATHAPGDAISDAFLLRAKALCVCIEPELVFHTRAHSTIILHADELRVRTYAVGDPLFDERSINHHVLHRHFVSLASLQCFHTSRDAPFHPQAYDTLEHLRLPPEVLRGTPVAGYARLVGRTHAYVLYDKHNRLRLHDRTRSVVAPERRDDASVHYLHHHMDLVQCMCPRFTLTATGEQLAALSSVYHLLTQSDPQHKQRTQHRDALMYSYAFDDAHYVVALVASYQRRIHDVLQRLAAYEAASLTDAGRAEHDRLSLALLDLYGDLCTLEEALFMSHASARDRSKHLALLVRARADAIEWNLVDAHDSMNVRLALLGTSFSRLALVGGTSIHCIALNDLHARNVHPSAYFPDIVTQHFPPAGHPMIGQRFLLAHWLLLAPSGGIQIMDRCELHLHPVRVQLELRIGRQVTEYLLGARRPQARDDDVDVEKRRPWLRHLVSMSRRARQSLRTDDSESDSLTDSESDDDHDAAAAATPLLLAADADDAVHLDALRAEMLHRASTNMSFMHVVLAAVDVCLSYKGDGEYSLTNLYDLPLQLPRLEYQHVLGTHHDLVDLLRRDLIRIAWNHRHTLLKGVISTNARKHAALKSLQADRLSQADSGADADTDDEPSRPSRWRQALSSRLAHVADDAASLVSQHDEHGRFRRWFPRHKPEP